ncbi:hypothetical protein H6F74_28550 [Trichocoleus sp. FACHB-90]|uniref:hypothetical protein n=1 Tax=Cyanophyceae TaxID=3028117 RepID=UPI001685C453|nr:hypothetical protein [Trichocoleus sp. FACHB-90]MBD1930141.1 hypothetical protein [Trichocoleus sp. FACHB-90]
MKTFSEALSCAPSRIYACFVLPRNILLPRYILRQRITWREGKHFATSSIIGSSIGSSYLSKNSAGSAPALCTTS